MIDSLLSTGILSVLIGIQFAAFTWRIEREVSVAEKGDINWLPPADILNLISIVLGGLGIFFIPLLGIENPVTQKIILGTYLILFLAYPFALAGHYDLYTRGTRSYAYFTFQEKIVVLITILTVLLFFFTLIIQS